MNELWEPPGITLEDEWEYGEMAVVFVCACCERIYRNERRYMHPFHGGQVCGWCFDFGDTLELPETYGWLDPEWWER
jgi:hypothetical protein